jgi:hypothetical protein
MSNILLNSLKPNSVGTRGCVKSLTSVARWPGYMLISEGNPHLTSRFCRVELGPTPNSKRALVV